MAKTPEEAEKLRAGLYDWGRLCSERYWEALDRGDQTEADKWLELFKHTAEGVRKVLEEDFPFRKA
jgi:hypothetical protein